MSSHECGYGSGSTRFRCKSGWYELLRKKFRRSDSILWTTAKLFVVFILWIPSVTRRYSWFRPSVQNSPLTQSSPNSMCQNARPGENPNPMTKTISQRPSSLTFIPQNAIGTQKWKKEDMPTLLASKPLILVRAPNDRKGDAECLTTFCHR